MKGKTGRILCTLLALTLLITSFAVYGENEVRDGTVRVWLSSLGSPLSLQLTVCGSYSVNGEGVITLGGGQSALVRMDANTGELTLTSGDRTYSLGTQFALKRHACDTVSGIRIAQSKVPANLYPADFVFASKSSGGSCRLYCVAHVFTEDYLCGVLPYEIGNSAKTEALRAQAVCSRTYVMRKKSGNPDPLYDVVDTNSDQVYRGTPSDCAACKAAVEATRGMTLRYNGVFAATFFTASNGGQTESAANAWGSKGYDYLKVKDDPYDLASGAKKLSFSVSAEGSQENTALGTILNNKASAVFGKDAKITSVYAVTAHTPRYASPSRLYTGLDFDVTYTLGGKTAYGTLTFDIFSELERQLGMNISSGDTELWSVESTANGFTVTARRHGNGIGMSQNGAGVMASRGKTWQEILAFYFEGCEIRQYDLYYSMLGALGTPHEKEARAVFGPESENDITLPTIAAPVQGRVNTVSGSLNLRKSASDKASVLMTIPQNTVITILEKGETWCKTQYGGKIGYVMTAFIDFNVSGDPTPRVTATPADTPTAAPTATPGTGAMRGRVTTASGSLNLRATVNGKVITTIPQNALIDIVYRDGDWYCVVYNGAAGYVMAKYVTLVSGGVETPAPTNAPTARPTAAPTERPAQEGRKGRVTTESGSLNLRASKGGKVLLTVPQYAYLDILYQDGDWYRAVYNGVTGYVMKKYVTLTDAPAVTPQKTTAAPVITPRPTAAPSDAEAQYARVTTVSGSLNLRQTASSSARVLRTIPNHAVVNVLNRGSRWCRVSYEGVTGFVMTTYLTMIENTAPAPTKTPVTAAPATAAPTAPVSGGRAVVVTQKGSLNLRETPDQNGRILRTVPQFAYADVLERGAFWTRIGYAGQTGWVMTAYLAFENGAAADPSAARVPESALREKDMKTLNAPLTGYAVPSGTSLNLRDGCSSESNVLCTIPRYSELTVLSLGSEWCEVQYAHRTGFCMRKYVSFSEP